MKIVRMCDSVEITGELFFLDGKEELPAVSTIMAETVKRFPLSIQEDGTLVMGMVPEEEPSPVLLTAEIIHDVDDCTIGAYYTPIFSMLSFLAEARKDNRYVFHCRNGENNFSVSAEWNEGGEKEFFQRKGWKLIVKGFSYREDPWPRNRYMFVFPVPRGNQHI